MEALLAWFRFAECVLLNKSSPSKSSSETLNLFPSQSSKNFYSSEATLLSCRYSLSSGPLKFKRMLHLVRMTRETLGAVVGILPYTAGKDPNF
jgi:hypothetical protein